jgi:hypothetical protein
LPQARDDPIAVRYVFAAEPENVGRAGKLLFITSPVFLGKSGVLNGDRRGDRYGKAKNYSVRSHVRSFFRISTGVPVPRHTSGLKINEAGESSQRTINREIGHVVHPPLEGLIVANG